MELHFGDDQARFLEIKSDSHHDHLVCRKSGLIIEFNEPKIEELQSKVAAAHQYAIKDHRHELYGFCSKCVQG